MKHIANLLLLQLIGFTSLFAQSETKWSQLNKFNKQITGIITAKLENNSPLTATDYRQIQALGLEASNLFESFSENEQGQTASIANNIFYNTACAYSLDNKADSSILFLEKCIAIDWFDVEKIKKNEIFDNIRNTDAFARVLQNANTKYIVELKKTPAYRTEDKAHLPQFTYQSKNNDQLKQIKNYFNLDSIAGKGDEISRILNVMTWLHNTITHNGSHWANIESYNAIDLYNYSRENNTGLNCRALAIALNDCYLSLGIKSRYITCLPSDELASDAHVINSVYVKSLDKWIWIDPTFNAYVKDEKGNFLSIEEVRERLINDEPLVLNDDANWNNKIDYKKAFYLDYYMAKLLYSFNRQCDSKYESETPNGGEHGVYLIPTKHKITVMGIPATVTHDSNYFWEH